MPKPPRFSDLHITDINWRWEKQNTRRRHGNPHPHQHGHNPYRIVTQHNPLNHDFGKKGTWRITTSRTSISQFLNGQTSSRLKFTHHTHNLKLNSPERHGNHIPPTATDQSHQQAHRQKVRTHGSPSRKDCFRGKNCEGNLHQRRREQNCEEEGPQTPLTHTILASLERLWHHNGLFWLILASQKRTSGRTSYPWALIFGEFARIGAKVGGMRERLGEVESQPWRKNHKGA